MNPRDRIIKAMNLEQPDRVPVMCQFSIGFMNQQLKGTGITPMELWLDAEKYAEALIFLRDKFDFDGILVSIHGHTKNWRQKIRKLEIVDGFEKATFEDHTELYLDDDLPIGNFFEPRQRDLDSINPRSIPEKLDYIAASKDCYFFIDEEDPYRVFKILDDKLKRQYSIHGEVTSPFDYLLDLIGYQNALMALVLEPDKVQLILDKFTVGVVNMAVGLAKSTEIDAIKISSPFTGMGFISPDHYRQFELPYISRVVDAVKNCGKTVYIHTCGHINDRLEIMKESGMSGLECLDPPPIGNTELEDAFNRVGDSMFIKGNIDSVSTLLNGNEESITADVAKRIRVGMQNKGFILSTACSIAPKVPRENIELLAKLANEIGGYGDS